MGMGLSAKDLNSKGFSTLQARSPKSTSRYITIYISALYLF